MARRVEVEIVGDASQLKRSLGDAEKTTNKFGKAAGVAGVAITGGLVFALKKSVDAAKDAQVSQARMESQLKALGISYKAHAGQIENVIQKTSKLAALDDEDLQDSFTALARTTGNVSQALKDSALAADIARGKNISLEAATSLVTKAELGKAGALTKAGIEVDKGATKIELLDTLHRKFAGSAEAYGKTGAAAQERFGIAVENLEESLGKMLLPTLGKVAAAGAHLAEFFEKHKTLAKALAIGIGVLGGALLAASVATKAMAAAQMLMNLAFVASPIGLVVVSLLALGVGLVEAWKHSETFRDIVTGAFDKVKEAGQAIADFVTKTIPGAFQDVKDWVTNHWPEIATLVSGPFAPLVALATDAFGVRSKLEGAFTAIKKWAGDRIDDIVGFFTGMGGRIWGAFSAGWDTVKGNVAGAFDFVKTHVSGVIGDIVGFWRDMPGKVAAEISKFGHLIGDKIKAIFSALPDAIEELLGIKSPSTRFEEIGHNIVMGAVRGLEKAGPTLLKKATAMFGDVGAGASGGGFFGKGGTEFGATAAADAARWGVGKQLVDEIAIGEALGLHITSGYRPGAHTKHGTLSDHARHAAVDMSGSAAAMSNMFSRLIGRTEVRQAFYDPRGSIFAGKYNSYREGGHTDHIHVAEYDRGGFLPTGLSLALNNTGRPEMIVPVGAGRMGGDLHVHVHTNNVIGTNLDEAGRQLAAPIRKELLRTQNRNGNLGFT